MNYSQEDLMKELQKYHFAAMDLHLYLDTHPTDRNALMRYNQYAQHLNMLKDIYTKTYGMLDMHSPSYQYPFSWVVMPWPWMRLNYMAEEEE